MPGYNNKKNNSLIIQNLNQQLNDEKIKNQKLESEIQQLKNELSSYKQIKLQQEKKINSLTIKNQQLEKEIQNLRNENQSIKNKQNNQINIDEINKLNQIIMQKDNKIKELELQLQKNNKNKIYVDDMMVVNFMSVDQSINTGIACTAENTLAEVEEKLYQMYNEYRNTNNILMHKGNVALRFKKIKENKIKNGDKIIVDIPQ
jgi:tropomyosin